MLYCRVWYGTIPCHPQQPRRQSEQQNVNVRGSASAMPSRPSVRPSVSPAKEDVGTLCARGGACLIIFNQLLISQSIHS